MKKGILIAIEGIDSSGKATQTKLLVERLHAEGRTVMTLSFPRYGEPVVEAIRKYLKENPTKDPYEASKLYAKDREDASAQIRSWLGQGDVILDRFTDSNAAHQGGKIADERSRKEYTDWLFRYEYGELGIPKPDLVIILHLPLEANLSLLTQRGGAKDGHEADPNHLRNAQASYLWLARQYPADHKIIDCAPEGTLLSREAIASMIYDIITPLLQ